MILSAEELEILEYLKGYSGKYIPLVEVCRRAGGRQRYSESPNWARGLISRLVEAQLVQVNERGHYRVPLQEKPNATTSSTPSVAPETAALVAEDYFPGAPSPASAPAPELIVDENYFAPSEGDEDKQWVSPHIAAILKKSGKKFTPKPPEE